MNTNVSENRLKDDLLTWSDFSPEADLPMGFICTSLVWGKCTLRCGISTSWMQHQRNPFNSCLLSPAATLKKNSEAANLSPFQLSLPRMLKGRCAVAHTYTVSLCREDGISWIKDFSDSAQLPPYQSYGSQWINTWLMMTSTKSQKCCDSSYSSKKVHFGSENFKQETGGKGTMVWVGWES